MLDVTFPEATSQAAKRERCLCVTAELGFQSHSRSCPQLSALPAAVQPPAQSLLLGLPAASGKSLSFYLLQVRTPSPGPVRPLPTLGQGDPLFTCSLRIPIPLPVVQGHISPDRGQDQTLQCLFSPFGQAPDVQERTPTQTHPKLSL